MRSPIPSMLDQLQPGSRSGSAAMLFISRTRSAASRRSSRSTSRRRTLRTCARCAALQTRRGPHHALQPLIEPQTPRSRGAKHRVPVHLVERRQVAIMCIQRSLPAAAVSRERRTCRVRSTATSKRPRERAVTSAKTNCRSSRRTTCAVRSHLDQRAVAALLSNAMRVCRALQCDVQRARRCRSGDDDVNIAHLRRSCLVFELESVRSGSRKRAVILPAIPRYQTTSIRRRLRGPGWPSGCFL